MPKSDAYLYMQTSRFDLLKSLLMDELPVTGISGLDRDHREILEEFVHIQNPMENFRLGRASESDWRAVAKLLARLKRHSKHHFAGEEAYLEKINSPHLEQHKAQHREFIERIKAYKTVLDQKDETKIFGLKYDLFNWLYEHINTMDSEINQETSKLPFWKNAAKGQFLFPYDLAS